MSAENKALVRRWFEEVWNHGNTVSIYEMFPVGRKCYGFPDPDGVVGVEEFVQTHKNFTSAFSDIHVTIDDLIAEDDRVAVRLTCTMKHTGEGIGVSPTGQAVTLKGVTITRIEDGKIAEGWNYFDIPGLVSKLQSCAAAKA